MVGILDRRASAGGRFGLDHSLSRTAPVGEPMVVLGRFDRRRRARGHLARKEIREKGLGGDTMAIFGLILGYVGLTTFAALVGMMWVGAISNASFNS